MGEKYKSPYWIPRRVKHLVNPERLTNKDIGIAIQNIKIRRRLAALTRGIGKTAILTGLTTSGLIALHAVAGPILVPAEILAAGIVLKAIGNSEKKRQKTRDIPHLLKQKDKKAAACAYYTMRNRKNAKRGILAEQAIIKKLSARIPTPEEEIRRHRKLIQIGRNAVDADIKLTGEAWDENRTREAIIKQRGVEGVPKRFRDPNLLDGKIPPPEYFK